jgi:hypothetical protein
MDKKTMNSPGFVLFPNVTLTFASHDATINVRPRFEHFALVDLQRVISGLRHVYNIGEHAMGTS